MQSQQVKALAHAVGFDLAGVAPAQPGARTEFLRDWLARGYAGEMAYLERRVEERVDPRQLLPGARSMVVVGLVYDPEKQPAPGLAATGQVARYAGGEDYHELMLDRLRALESALQAALPSAPSSRCYVDTGPILERAHAAQAGLGWVGKNTCLIHPRLGSYLFLGVLISALEFEADTPEPDHCGSCRACLDACPTDAFPEPYVLDATRCISYSTIESRSAIPEPLREAHGDWVFGCDICQQVCPWNSRRGRSLPPDHASLRERLAPRSEWLRPRLEWILGLDEDAWRAATRRTALRRAKWRGLMRNALVAAGNSGDAKLIGAVRRYAASDDALLAEHARWALQRLEKS